MKNNDTNIAQAIEDLSELVSLAKQDNKKHLNEVLENVLRESELTGFKGSSITQSINNAMELFKDQIEYSEDQLQKRKSFYRKQVLKQFAKKYFFKLGTTIISVVILCLMIFPFLNYIVQGLISGKIAPQSSNPEEGDIIYAAMMFWIIGTWNLADSVYKRYIDKNSFYKSNLKEKIFKIYLIFVMTLLAYYLPAYQEIFRQWAISSHESLTIYTLINIILTPDGIGVLIVPLWLIATILNLKKFTEKI